MADEQNVIRSIRQAKLERRLKRRAKLEGMVLLAVPVAAFVLVPGPRLALLSVLVLCGIGVPLYITRRSRDLRLLTHAQDWRRRALEGRGTSLADWHGGGKLPPWADRR